MWRTAKPSREEHAPYYAAYVEEAPDGDLMATFRDQMHEVAMLTTTLRESRGDYRYAPGKWSIKEVIGHLADSERVFAYRALRFARADQTELPGFDENAWMPAAGFGSRTLESMRGEFCAVRLATAALLEPMDDEVMARSGVANGQRVTVRALAWIISGHSAHHLRILRERYLAG